MLWFWIVSECFDSYIFIYSRRSPYAISIFNSSL
jgi:hypothetical protein